MKTHKLNSFRRFALPSCIAIAMGHFTQSIPAADVLWDGGAAGTGTGWRIAANWVGDAVPGNTDVAIVDATGTVTTLGIDMNGAGGTQQVGAFVLGPSRSTALTVRNSSTTTAGTLVLNGAGGLLLSNATALTLTITDGTSQPMGLGLGTSGDIYVSGTQMGVGGTIQISSIISEVGGPRSINKLGGGTLYLRGVNTYSGNTTNAEGAIQFDATGTLGNGTGTLYLTGGNLVCNADRSGGAPLANPVVLAGDCIVLNNAGLTGTSRTLNFSGPWSGTSGSLRIINNTAVANQTFQLRLIGGFTFDRNIAIGAVPSGSFATLQLYNSATNGIQTYTGVISDDPVATGGAGAVWRSGAAGSPPGMASFTGDNTYNGGTRISYGTLLANNTTGSALGYGQVTVTNQGIFGGSGSVLATTHVGVENPGGTVSPGSLATNVGNLTISDLTFGPGATYLWQISSVSGSAGSAWDLITCSSQWTDAGTSGNPIAIKLDSFGVAPAGWNSGTAYDWVILQSGTATAFDSTHFTVDVSSFGGAIAGGFGLYVSSGSLHLTYTPGSDLVINVPSGTQTQAAAGYPTISGNVNVIKVGNGEVVFDNPANSYSGLTKVLAGTLSLAADALNGSGTLGANSSPTLLGNTTGTSNAILNINTAGVTDAHSVTVQVGSSGTKTIGTTLTSGTATYAGDITLNDRATLSAAAGGTAAFTGDLKGSGGLTLGGGGALTLSGVGSYAGTTTVSSVTLNLNAKSLGTNTLVLNSGVTLDNTSGGAVTLNSCPQIWNADFSFTGSTNLSLGSGPVTLSANRAVTVNASTLTVGGTISGSAGLTKLGAGTLALTATNAYTGGTTNAAGVLSVNATATFGDGTGPLVLSGGNLYNTSSRSGTPIANPVRQTADCTVYGASADTPPSTRYLPFSGPFTVTGGTFKVGNLGLSNSAFAVRLVGTNYTTINWPITVGDAGFDTPGAISLLELANDNTSPTQFVSTAIAGAGIVRRGPATVGALNTGGTTVFTKQSTFSGGAVLWSGAIGFGTNSTSSGGAVVSGPIGTGTFTIGNANNEAALGIFAYGGPRVIENPLFLNGGTNILVTGTDNLTFTGPVNAGGITKTWNVQGTGIITVAGQITNSTAGNGAQAKAGPGTLVFSGDNLYAGTTTVREGKLLVNNTTGSGTSTNTVIVLNTATLGGTGTIAGPVVVTNGTVAPGTSAGNLTLGSDLDLSNGGRYAWELAANSTASPGVNFDRITMTGGNLVLGGSSQLVLSFTGSATAPDGSNPFWQSARTWTIVALSGTAANPGSTAFASIVNGTYSAGSFTNYADAGGNIVLAFTPNLAPPQPQISPNIVGAGTASTTISWSAASGYTYTVQCKTNLNQPGWLTLGTSTATGSTASYTDTTGPHTERYYRVIWP